MLKKDIHLELTISKTGVPCLWECGGGMTNTGHAQIITDKCGHRKRAIYLPTKGELSNGNHALIPVSVGDTVVLTHRHKNTNEIALYNIIEISDNKAVLEFLRELIVDTKNIEKECLPDAFIASIHKANDYHCCRPYFALPPKYIYQRKDSPCMEIQLSNLTITSIESDIIIGTVDVFFSNKDYRATYSYGYDNGANIEGFLDLETDMHSMSGVYLLNEYNSLAERAIINYIEDNIRLNRKIHYAILSLNDDSAKPI